MSTYEVEGISYPSVTTIQGVLDKPFLVPWALNTMAQWIDENIIDYNGSNLDDFLFRAKNDYKNISKEALDIGSSVHDMIAKYISEGKDAIGEMRSEIENGMIAFFEWESENVETWLESEKKVYSPDLGYAGTLDAIARMKDGKIYLIDFKTSKSFYDGYGEQLSAYRYARQNLENKKIVFKHKTDDKEMMEFEYFFPKISIEGMGILRLDKETGIPEWKDYSKTYTRKLETWKSLVKFYYLQKNRRLKNNPFVKEVKKYD